MFYAFIGKRGELFGRAHQSWGCERGIVSGLGKKFARQRMERHRREGQPMFACRFDAGGENGLMPTVHAVEIADRQGERRTDWSKRAMEPHAQPRRFENWFKRKPITHSAAKYVIAPTTITTVSRQHFSSVGEFNHSLSAPDIQNSTTAIA
jgi:hypothetical protein